jgi:hypothetical protein
MTPTVVSKAGGITSVMDAVGETWLYQNGQLEYVPRPVPDPPPRPNDYILD